MTTNVWIVFDLGFGDAGKGATVDFLVRDLAAELVVRFHGGAQAGHNVVTPDGGHHTFSQFGAGTFVAGTRTLLGPAFVLHPGALLIEEEHLQSCGINDAMERTEISGEALVISPFQQAAGRLRELQRGSNAHGTCGVGVGEAVQDALFAEPDTIRARELLDLDKLAPKLESQRCRKLQLFGQTVRLDDPRIDSELSLLEQKRSVDSTLEFWRPLQYRLQIVDAQATRRRISSSETAIFEGAQGVLLDQDVGFHPHTTWSDCTLRGAFDMLNGIPHRPFRLGVLRSYMVRHGQGPFPTEDPEFLKSARESHNSSEGWQGNFRRGPLDLVLIKYALQVAGGADGLAVTCLDAFENRIPFCKSYELDGQTLDAIHHPPAGDLAALQALGDQLQRCQPRIEYVAPNNFLAEIEQFVRTRVCLNSCGPMATDRHWRL